MTIFIILVIITAVILALTARNASRSEQVRRIYREAYRSLLRKRYFLAQWPEVQGLMDLPGFDTECRLVLPDTHDLDSSYMVPTDLEGVRERCDGDFGTLYVRFDFPKSQDYEGRKDALKDYDGSVYVPVKD